MKNIFFFIFSCSLLFSQQYGNERVQWQLNPEISVLGDFFINYLNEKSKTEAVLEEVELSFQTPLDPFTRMKVFLGIHKEEEGDIEDGSEHHQNGYHLHLEETYITWVGLAPNIAIDAGKFRTPFGTYNRWHPHALPILNYPLYIRKFFGEEGLSGTGISGSILFSGIGTNELNIQGLSHNRKNELLAHYKSYFDLSPESYFEIGLSFFSPDKKYYGADFTFLYEPTAKAKYNHFQMHFEYGKNDENAGYLFLLEKKFTRRITIGASYEYFKERMEFAETTKIYSGILTFWQSEFVRFRLHLINEKIGGKGEKMAALQITFAAGPHKHEEY